MEQEELKEFMRQYKDLIFDTPYGEIHVCGDKTAYEELLKDGKLAFSPPEVALISKAAQNGTLDTIVKIKASIPGAKLKEIIEAEQNSKHE